MTGDPFRYCVHCGADCYLPKDEQEHAADCPVMTNVYPITMCELGMRGPGDPYAHGMCCSECLSPFELGDSYSYRTLQEQSPCDCENGCLQCAPILEPICLGCAAVEALT